MMPLLLVLIKISGFVMMENVNTAKLLQHGDVLFILYGRKETESQS
jgi:hypothetical protein